MKRKPIRALISLLLVLALSTGALAVNPDAMTDIAGHWAREDIRYCLENNLFNGTSATTFTPNDEMTRGMFVTVLGRIAGIKASAYPAAYTANLYTDVDSKKYYASSIVWASAYGIVNGVGNRLFKPDLPITREQMATMVNRYLDVYGYSLKKSTTAIPGRFTDSATISGWAVDSVDYMRLTGILNGYPDGRFAPKDTATRAMCAKMFHLVKESLYQSSTPVLPTGVAISQSSLELKVGASASLTATVSPSYATVKHITWTSSDTSIATVEDGKVVAKASGSAKIYATTCNGYSQYCTVTVQPDASLAYAGDSTVQKYIWLFGYDVGDHHGYYLNRGGPPTTTISVPIWQFTDSTHTSKHRVDAPLVVHTKMAATFKAIFNEIFYGPEKFPIYAVHCYRGGETGEHGLATAVDINPDENYECYNDGTPMSGSYWRPGVDPYSILPNGDVVKAFYKYGFGWGGNFNRKKDYMHFSYFKT